MGMEDNKKNLIIGAGVIFFILLVTVGSLIFFKLQTGKITKVLDSEEYEEYDKYYVMITQERNSEFWESVYEGAKEDGKEHNAYVELMGDNLAEDYSREELMEIATNSGVDGIIVEADESLRMTELIDAATEAQIPVITVLGDNTSSTRQSFVGIGSYNLGREYGRQVIKLCGGDVRDVLILVSSSADGTDQNVLYSGIQETIDNEMKTGGQARLDVKTVNNESAFAVEESIRDIFINSETLPDIIICPDEQSTTCVRQAVVDYNKVGVIDIIGYYNTPATLQAIERKIIYSTVSIDAKQMGRLCVEALDEYNELGNVSEYFSVDVAVINSNNVRDYSGGNGEDE